VISFLSTANIKPALVAINTLYWRIYTPSVEIWETNFVI